MPEAPASGIFFSYSMVLALCAPHDPHDAFAQAKPAITRGTLQVTV